MKTSLKIKIAFFFFGFLLIVFPYVIHASEIDSSMQPISPDEIVETHQKMTQKEMNDLFGEDPYLGQTSYLQSPDGFSQRSQGR